MRKLEDTLKNNRYSEMTEAEFAKEANHILCYWENFVEEYNTQLTNKLECGINYFINKNNSESSHQAVFPNC